MRLVSIALAAAAAMAGVPAAAGDKSSVWIRVQSLPLGGGMAQPAQGGAASNWIEIQGWDWESPGGTLFKGEITTIEPAPATAVDKWKPTKPHAREGASKVDGFTVKQSVKPVRPVGTSDLTLKRGTSPAMPAPSATSPSSRRFDGPMDYDQGDTGTHEATRPARPLAVGGSRTKGPSPPDKFGRVKVRFSWPDCVEGRRLHSIELRDATGHYVLEGARVARCSADGVSVNFSNVRKVWAGQF